MFGLVRCPPSCRANCAIKHHPLLVAVLNCADTPEEGDMKNRIADLKHVVSIYKQHQDWDIACLIPDAMESYRLTLGHWACSLGRVEAMKWLVENGYPPTTVCPRTGDSCLHFALLRLLESCPYLASKKFEELVKVIKPALESPDRFGNTVMHLCCDMLQKGMPRKDFYMAALDVMCQYARQTTPDKVVKILNSRNLEGDTPLHILAKGCGYLKCARQLVDSGADIELPNQEGLTPIELAVKNRQTQMAMFFDSVLRSRGKTHKLATYMEKMRLQKIVLINKVQPGEKTEKGKEKPTWEIMKDLEKLLGKPEAFEQNTEVDSSKRSHDEVEKEFNSSDEPSAQRLCPSSPPTVSDESVETPKDAAQENDDKEPIIINMQVPHLQLAGQELSEPAVMSISITDGGEALEGFLMQCEEGLKSHILEAVLKAQEECTKSQEAIDEKCQEIRQELSTHRKEKKSTVLLIQSMIDRLRRLQAEEHTLRKQLFVTQREMGSVTYALKGFKERQSHCQAALDALNSIK